MHQNIEQAGKEKWVALSSLSFMFPLQTQPNTKLQMSSGFCLYGADCTARAVFEKHLIRMIRCPCRAALNAVFFLYCYGFLWECGDRPHGGEGMAVLGKNKKFFFNFFSKKPTELDGDAGLPQAYLFQWRQWLTEERKMAWMTSITAIPFKSQ